MAQDQILDTAESKFKGLVDDVMLIVDRSEDDDGKQTMRVLFPKHQDPTRDFGKDLVAVEPEDQSGEDEFETETLSADDAEAMLNKLRTLGWDFYEVTYPHSIRTDRD